MKKHNNLDLDSLNQSLLKQNQKTIKKLNKLVFDSAVQKSEKKLHKTAAKLLGK